MNNFLNKFRRGSHSSTVDEKKGQNSKHPKNTPINIESYKNLHPKEASIAGTASASNIQASTSGRKHLPFQNAATTFKSIKTNPTIPNQSKHNHFSISLSPKEKSSLKKNETSDKNAKNKPNNEQDKDDLNVLGLIIDPANTQEIDDSSIQIFDPEPAPEETDTCEQITYIDDRNFIFDDDDEILEKLDGLAKENNCFTINEVPEGRLSKLSSKSSRASSRASSIGSNSTRGSSNVLDRDSSDQLSNEPVKQTEASDESGSELKMQNGSKNVLLDALIKKFNVSMDIDTTDQKIDTLDSQSDTSGPKVNSLVKNKPMKYHGTKQQSELQRKINRSNLNKNNSSIADGNEDGVDASSSYDDNPKPIKIVKSTSTQITRTLNKRNKNFKTVSVTRLPQNFECKYIGKTKCTGLWGLKHIRDPVDYLVNTSRKLKSLDELPGVEALISEKGVYIVQKSKAQSSKSELSDVFKPLNTDSKLTQETSKLKITEEGSLFTNDEGAPTSGKYYQSGLLPISNISYAVQDNVYGKVFSCIVVRECDSKTISECYSFLCKKNEVARRMALSITLAFKEYGKLLQLKETRINRKIEIHGGSNEKEGDSFA